MKKIKKILYPICAVGILFALWNLQKIDQSTKRTEKLYHELAKQWEQERKTTGSKEAGDKDAGMVETERGGASVANAWLLDLQQQNQELAGWIRIPDTEIDYPVMQTKEDNDYYLTHDFEREENVHGTPFLDVNCKIGESENLIIYGHHMKDGTMFQNLMLYEDPKYCESNGIIEFDTPEESQQYQVIFVMLLSEEDTGDFPYYKCTDLAKEELYQGFLTRCSQYAIWQSNDLPDPGTQLLTLSTCEYSRENGRLVVVAKERIE